MLQKFDHFGRDLSRSLLLRPVTTAWKEQNLAQLWHSLLHGPDICEANGAVALPTYEEHRLFHADLTQASEFLPITIQILLAIESPSEASAQELPGAIVKIHLSEPARK